MARVKSVRVIGKEDVYNMEVENTHNYSINGGLIVHNCDALRYFAIQWARPNPLDVKSDETEWTADMWEDYNNASTQEERDQIIYIYGKPRNMSANERIITL